MKALKWIVGATLLVGAGFLYLAPTKSVETSIAQEESLKKSAFVPGSDRESESKQHSVDDTAETVTQLNAAFTKASLELSSVEDTLAKRGRIVEQLKELEKELDEQRLSATQYSERRRELVQDLKTLLSSGT